MNSDSKYYDEYYAYRLDEKEPSSKELKAVFSIIHDLTGRKGIGNEFEEIDGSIQDEIIEKWIECIREITSSSDTDSGK